MTNIDKFHFPEIRSTGNITPCDITRHHFSEDCLLSSRQKYFLLSRMSINILTRKNIKQKHKAPRTWPHILVLWGVTPFSQVGG
jgi:hypothetical protein